MWQERAISFELESVCFAKDTYEFEFLEILCWPKETPLQAFSAIGPPVCDPGGENKAHGLVWFCLRTGNSEF